MICEEYKVFFIHINKTGGRSIESCFNFPKEHLKLHMDTKYWMKQRAVDWQEYYKFSFVRNPWDKEVSDYFYNTRTRKHIKQHLTFEQYMTLVYGWSKGHPKHGRFHRNQLDWLRGLNGKIEMTFIGRFERLQLDFMAVCQHIGKFDTELPKKNATEHEHYSTYYNEETKNMVDEMYSEDIEFFNYKFEDNNESNTHFSNAKHKI